MFDNDACPKKYFLKILNTLKYAPDQKENTTTITNSVLVGVWVMLIKMCKMYIYIYKTYVFY